MKESAAPKAINIIRPSKQQRNTKRNRPRFVSNKPSKIFPQSQIHEKMSTFILYDPKQNTQPPFAMDVEPLKTPVNGLYNKPEKYQQLSSPPFDKPKQIQNLPELSEQEETDDDYDDNDSDTDDTARKEERNEQDEARINRKIADLEISNKSLQKINGILEATVRHQAKQVASFKKQSMTCPENEQIREQAETQDDWENDEQFNRLKRMTEMLIEQAQRALLFQAQAGGRVIVAERSNSTTRHGNAHYSNSNNDENKNSNHAAG